MVDTEQRQERGEGHITGTVRKKWSDDSATFLFL